MSMSDLPIALVHAAFPSWDTVGRRAEDLWPAIVWSAIIILVTYAVSRVASMRLRSALARSGFDLHVAILLARLIWLGVWVIGFLLVLYQFGIGLTPLAALIGVLGLAASLSLQTVLQNLVAGVYLLAEHPFQIGDFIAVVAPGGVNHEGRVEDIQVRTTHLRNRDNELILMPNSTVFSGVVTNRTAVGGCVRHLKVTFPRQVDVDSARGVIVPLLQGLPEVLPAPAPLLRVECVETETWTGALSIWGRTLDVDSDAIWAIGQAFPDASVSDGAGPV
jgi:small-conductance mechanosensitive channel